MPVQTRSGAPKRHGTGLGHHGPGFHDLPAEIRNQIYDLVLTDPETAHLALPSHKRLLRSDATWGPLCPLHHLQQPALTLASRQVQGEALPVFLHSFFSTHKIYVEGLHTFTSKEGSADGGGTDLSIQLRLPSWIERSSHLMPLFERVFLRYYPASHENFMALCLWERTEPQPYWRIDRYPQRRRHAQHGPSSAWPSSPVTQPSRALKDEILALAQGSGPEGVSMTVLRNLVEVWERGIYREHKEAYIRTLRA